MDYDDYEQNEADDSLLETAIKKIKGISAPLITNKLMKLSFVSVLGLFSLYYITANYPASVMRGQLWRLFLSPFFSQTFVESIGACFAFYVLGLRLEQTRGSVCFLASILIHLVLSNILFVLLFVFVLPAEYFDQDAHFYAGPWPIIFGLLVFETWFSRQSSRRIFFLPYDFPTKITPLVMWACFCILIRFDIASFAGIISGFIAVLLPPLRLPASNCIWLEKTRMFRWMIAYEGYVSVSEGENLQRWYAQSSTRDAPGTVVSPDQCDDIVLVSVEEQDVEHGHSCSHSHSHGSHSHSHSHSHSRGQESSRAHQSQVHSRRQVRYEDLGGVELGRFNVHATPDSDKDNKNLNHQAGGINKSNDIHMQSLYPSPTSQSIPGTVNFPTLPQPPSPG